MDKAEILKPQKSGVKEISEGCQNSERILKSAKKIMDNFHQALGKVEKLEESRVERDECEREEKEPWKTSEEFRKTLLENAPRTKGDCIEAEKGKWTN